MVWADSFTAAVGPYLVGLRAHDGPVGERLRDLLAPLLVDGDDVPRHYGVRVEPARRGTRPLHSLYRGGHAVVRSRSPRRVVEALLDHLDDHLDQRDPAEGAGGRHAEGALPRLVAAGLVSADGRAALVVGMTRPRLSLADRSLRRSGWTVVDRAAVLLDPADGAVVVPRRRIDVDAAAVEAFGPLDDPGPAPGHYPVEAVVFTRSAPPTDAPRAVAHLVGSVENASAVGGQRMLDALAAAVSGARLVATGLDPRALPAALNER